MSTYQHVPEHMKEQQDIEQQALVAAGAAKSVRTQGN